MFSKNDFNLLYDLRSEYIVLVANGHDIHLYSRMTGTPVKSCIGILLGAPFTANGGNTLRSSWRLIISKSMIHGITIEQSGTKPLFRLKADIYIIERMSYAPLLMVETFLV